jgi:hypothetical protein
MRRSILTLCLVATLIVPIWAAEDFTGTKQVHYLIFLSIYQTLRRKGGSFLRFLLSGKTDLFEFLGEKGWKEHLRYS